MSHWLKLITDDKFAVSPPSKQWGSVEDFCEYGDELVSYIKPGNFLTS
jgi:hypothetical protein